MHTFCWRNWRNTKGKERSCGVERGISLFPMSSDKGTCNVWINVKGSSIKQFVWNRGVPQTLKKKWPAKATFQKASYPKQLILTAPNGGQALPSQSVQDFLNAVQERFGPRCVGSSLSKISYWSKGTWTNTVVLAFFWTCGHACGWILL